MNSPVEAQSTTLIDPNSLPLEMWQALLRRLNKRSQTVSNVFSGEYKINISHLENLMFRIEEEFSISKKLNISCNASILLSNNQKFDFTSWKELAELDKGSTNKTKSISFDLTVDTVNAENDTPERFRVQVSVQNNPAQFGITLGAIGLFSLESYGLPPAPIAVQVDFSNFVVGKNLMGTIEQWEKGLPRQDTKIATALQKHSGKFPSIFSYLTTSASLVISYTSLTFYLEGSPLNINSLTFIVSLTCFLTMTFYFLGRYLGKLAEKYVDRLSSGLNITHTVGDELYHAKLKGTNTKLYFKASGTTIAVLFQIVLALYADDLKNLIL